jgi:hypothetical protein
MTTRSEPVRGLVLGLLALAVVGTMSSPRPALADEPKPAGTAPKSDDDALGPLRTRFLVGREKYREHAYAEAIVIWTAIYRELGAEKGYRVAFALARAYDEFGQDASQAAEHYAAYLSEIGHRKDHGEEIEPDLIEKEDYAKQRLAELTATKGRLELKGDGRQVPVRIDNGATRLTDFVAYVNPDKPHVVTWNPGTRGEKQVPVTVPLGELAEVHAPPDEPPEAIVPPPPPVRYELHRERPYPTAVIYVAGGVAVASVLLPVLLFANAKSIQDDYNAAQQATLAANVRGDRLTGSISSDHATTRASDYSSAKTAAYASWAAPAILGLATAGLAGYWLWGTKEARVPVTGAFVPGGVVMGASARF